MQPTEIGTWISNWLINCVERTRESVDLLIPHDLGPGPGWMALILLVAALFVGVYGAKYARGLLSVVGGGAGFLAGVYFARNMEFHEIAGGLIGLVLVAALIYVTFRLWVGLSVGLLAATVGFFVYGHDSLWPEFLSYEPNPVALSAAEGTEYELPSAEEQQTLKNPNPLAYVKDFYTHLHQTRPSLAQNAAVLLILCLVVGFIFGSLATRWALIIAGAVLATVLFAVSLGTFAETFAAAGWESRLAVHPKATLGFVATCFILSLLVQVRMTQPAPHITAEQPKN